jgi:hypothetical protein
VEGLPPDLRSGQSRFPANSWTPQRKTTIAGREVNRPAAVMEALRSEAASLPDRATERREISSVPAALPNDEGKAQPLPAPPAVESPSIKPKVRFIPKSGDQPAVSTPAWQPATPPQPESKLDIASPEQHARVQAMTGPNEPAAIYARSVASDGTRSASRADYSISAPDSPAALAVRAVSEQSWSQNSPHRNPLRSGSPITKVAFEYTDTMTSDIPPARVSAAEKATESTAQIPANPLRK